MYQNPILNLGLVNYITIKMSNKGTYKVLQINGGSQSFKFLDPLSNKIKTGLRTALYEIGLSYNKL